MKKIFLFLLITNCINFYAFADSACPSGSVQQNYTSVKIVSSTVCPSGYKIYKSIESCENNPAVPCFMYLGPGVEMQDTTGTYEYTDICLYTE